MNELRKLEDWAGALLVKLEPRERRRVNQSIARNLRRSQQQRIRAQRNPDGTAYEPRKKTTQRSRSGHIKRKKMFSRLSLAKHMRMNSTANAVGIAFMARNARIARVHQYGLHDSPGGKSPRVKYAKRELLGFSASDLGLVRNGLIDHLGDL